ncbi:hypothetical protein ABFV05_020668 [Capra hircus]
MGDTPPNSQPPPPRVARPSRPCLVPSSVHRPPSPVSRLAPPPPPNPVPRAHKALTLWWRKIPAQRLSGSSVHRPPSPVSRLAPPPPQPRASGPQSPDALVEEDSCPEALRELCASSPLPGVSPRPAPPPNPVPRAHKALTLWWRKIPAQRLSGSPDALVEEDSCPEALREVRTLVEVGGPSSEGEEDPNKGLREETQVESPKNALLVAQRTQAWRSALCIVPPPRCLASPRPPPPNPVPRAHKALTLWWRKIPAQRLSGSSVHRPPSPVSRLAPPPPQPRASGPQSPDALVEEDSCPEALREVRTLVEVGGPSSEGEEDPNKGLREETQVESPKNALLVAQRTQAWRSGYGEDRIVKGWGAGGEAGRPHVGQVKDFIYKE